MSPGEELINLIESEGISVKRLRPKDEICWAEINLGGKTSLEIRQHNVCMHLPYADIQIDLSYKVIQNLGDGCISVGNNHGFINIYTRCMRKGTGGKK